MSSPTRNFQSSYFAQYKNIDGKAVIERLKITDKGCFCCPTPCGKCGIAKTELGSVYVEGPQYESIALLGGACEVGSIEQIAYANYVCDELGLDTISAGAVTAWAMECAKISWVFPGSNAALDFGHARGNRFALSKAMWGLLSFRRTSLPWQEHQIGNWLINHHIKDGIHNK